MNMRKKTEEQLVKEWDELYDKVFPPIRKKHDIICEIFGQWNVYKIGTETAIRKLKALVKKWDKEETFRRRLK